MAAKTLTRQLVDAFGDIDTMQTLYSDDIIWSMMKSLGPIAGPYVGRDAVIEFNQRVWGSFYYPDVGIQVLDDLGTDASGAVRFIYKAKLRRTDEPYELEYIVFAHGRDGLLTEVFESLDTLGSANLFAGQPVDKNPYRG